MKIVIIMKILVLPGTVWQVPLMKKIKKLGHELFLVNPVKIEGVYEIADHFFKADIFAYDVIVPYCKENKIDIVMSEECDIAVDAVSRYNEAIGKNSISVEIAELFTNKAKMRSFCKKNNINPIPYAICTTISEACDFYKNNGPKLIMKPLDSNSSHGVVTVFSEQDIKDNFAEVLSFSRNENAIILEKYIEGPEFTVDGIMSDMGHVSLAISEKKHYSHNNNIAKTLIFTQSNPRFDYNLLRKTNDELINLTGLEYGLTHVEYKYMDGKYYLIEMAARGGGNLISAIIVPFISGIDNYDYLIRKTLDKKVKLTIKPNINNGKAAILNFLDLPYDGVTVRSISGEDFLARDKRIKAYKLNFKVGDYIKRPDSDSVRLGYYIACADSYDELVEICDVVERTLVVEAN